MRKDAGRARWLFLLAVFLAAPAAAIHLTIAYPVLERTLDRELFREQGRYYLAGGPDDDCSYTYVEQPRLGAEGARLVLRLHLSARLGREVLGQCVGPGEAFEVVISGVPKIEGTSVTLADAQLSFPEHPRYEVLHEPLLAPFITGPLAQALRFDLAAEIRRLTEGAAREGYRIQIGGLVLSGLRAAPGQLEVDVDFRASVTAGPAP